MDNVLGSTLAHYRIEAVLGRGGMGTVYRARDTELDRTVAIKVLSASSGEARRQLLHEARAASALSHAGIVTIHSIEQQGDTDFIVMEYVAGRSLAEAIPAGGLPLDEALDIASQVAAALAEAHDAGVVHRDIKPANIMIARGGQVKVLDFGVARRFAVDPQEATQMATRPGTIAPTGAIVGTAGYLAPEQIAGEPARPASDVFAFGATLFQMLTGTPPFAGGTMWAVMDATLTREPPPVDALRPEVPAAIARIVQRCLAKNAADRYQSGRELQAALSAARGTAGAAAPEHFRTTPVIALAVAVLLAASGAAAMLWVRAREQRAASARETAAAMMERADRGDLLGAYRMGLRAQERLGGDPAVRQAWNATVTPNSVTTDPPDAEVAVRAYDGSDEGWIPLGRTPLTQVMLPFTQLRFRIVKEGYEPLEVSPNNPEYHFELVPAGSSPDGMVHVPAGEFYLESTDQSVVLPAYWIDRYEVTNRQFKEFVDAGGYARREYWQHPIVDETRHELSWDEAMTRFRDATGRPGPSNWELGTFPDGEADHPVSGVSWYEAAAYATFAGKSLPTVYHWYRASGAFGIFSDIIRSSNFNGARTARVGHHHGLGPYGTYDMAGNVKEWCWNEASGGRRYVLGGSYNEATYQFRDQDARDPIDRSAGFGFRCIRQPAAIAASLRERIRSLERDPATLRPVDDALYEAYRRLHDYDPVPLDARIEEQDASPPHWTRQRVSFRAAYGSERVPAEVFVPKIGRPPYQAVVYFPGNDAVIQRSSRTMWLRWIEFLVRSGRIVVYPIYQQTYERRIEPPPAGQHAIRELQIQRAKDLRRAVDYLQSRDDVDGERIAGYGLSLGAQLMPVFLAIEPRLRTGVLLAGGFETWTMPPEVDPVNFAPRVRQPVLMLNGREDFDLPYDTAQVPLFMMLGTPAADKRHVVLDGGHVPEQPTLVFKEILDWLDRYLGRVQ